MGRLEGRLKRIETGVDRAAGKGRYPPPEVLVLCKAVERRHARLSGEEPPPYSPEEIAELRAQDVELVEGSGLGRLRTDPGWQGSEAQAVLDAAERGARRRLEAAEGLPPERWGEVWGADEEDEDEQEGDWCG